MTPRTKQRCLIQYMAMPDHDQTSPETPPEAAKEGIQLSQISNQTSKLEVIEADHDAIIIKIQETAIANAHQNLLLLINYACLFVGSVSASLITKFYFIHKGSSRWVSTWVQSAGFPVLLLPIYLPYYLSKSSDYKRRPFSGFTLKIFLLSVIVGVFMGLNNLLFSWGTSYLPVSTSSLLLSSQLAFNLVLSMLLVRQKVSFTNLNCVLLLTVSSVLIALGSSHDKPPGLTGSQYLVGFLSTIGAGLLFALYLPVMELIYRKVDCYGMVLEMQLVMEMAATALAIVGMGASHDGFSVMKVESTRVFDKGAAAYWVTVAATLVAWQLCFVGTAGMVFLTTSLTGGICMTALMGANVVGGVIIYGDKFGGMKAVSTVLCVWGFCSYLYGMYKKNHKKPISNQSSDDSMEEIGLN
ncbi:probable purine permease 4 [Henckelia pumila]|uniref:probable purine permease 4 n=1 Tax=Henckelia pumila TaxID=405737 RepID=UPI003C6E3911